MLYQSGYPGTKGPSLVSDEFNNLCTLAGVEARIEAFPNPGNPFAPMRKITFRNFNNFTLVIVQFNRRKTRTTLPARGECQILMEPVEDLPGIERFE